MTRLFPLFIAKILGATDFHVGFARMNLAAMRWHIERNPDLSASELFRLLGIVHSSLQETLPPEVTLQDIIIRAACPLLSKDVSLACNKMKSFMVDEELPDLDQSKVGKMYLLLLTLDRSSNMRNVTQLLQLIRSELSITIAPWLAVNVMSASET